MGSFDKCCCCLRKKTSAVVCTIIMILIFIYGLISETYTIVNKDGYKIYELMNIPAVLNYISVGINVIILFTLVFLLIGISQRKISLMKPFIYLYAIFLIINVAFDIYNSYIMIKFVNNITDEQLVKLYVYSAEKTSYDSSYLMKYPELFDVNVNNITNDDIAKLKNNSRVQTFKETFELSTNIGIIFSVFGIIIDLIYYITTRNYIKSVEKEEKEVDDVKSIENAY